MGWARPSRPLAQASDPAGPRTHAQHGGRN